MTRPGWVKWYAIEGVGEKWQLGLTDSRAFLNYQKKVASRIVVIDKDASRCPAARRSFCSLVPSCKLLNFSVHVA